MSGSVNKDILEDVNMLRSQNLYLQRRLQQEERYRLRAETKLEVWTRDFLPIIEKTMMRPNYHLEHVHTGHVGEISHSHDFQAGRTEPHKGSELDDVCKLMKRVQEGQDEIPANVNATAHDVKEFESAVASMSAQLEVMQPNRSTLKKAIETIQRIAEKTMTSGLTELAKRAASSLF
jgi:hypothetical protein